MTPLDRTSEDRASRSPSGPLAVLIPALNEEEALPLVLGALPRDEIDHLVVVDNGSFDDTPEVARDAGATVLFEERRGYGAACLAGIHHMERLEDPPAVLAFVDADAVSEAFHLDALTGPIFRGEADLVLGVRTAPRAAAPSDIPGVEGNRHAHARWGNRLVLGLTRLLFGRSFRDLAPFRAVRLDRLRELEMDDRSWGWTLQMQVRAVRAGLRILEVEVPHGERERGSSKISGSLPVSIRVGLKMFYTLIRERLR